MYFGASPIDRLYREPVLQPRRSPLPSSRERVAFEITLLLLYLSAVNEGRGQVGSRSLKGWFPNLRAMFTLSPFAGSQQ